MPAEYSTYMALSTALAAFDPFTSFFMKYKTMAKNVHAACKEVVS